MRQIKFRAWDEDLKMMMPEVDISAPLQSFKWLGRVDLPIMQFTGLKDKNGKEIYEEDIVICEGKKGLVRWNESEPMFWVRYGGNKANYLTTECEIIGNIYENKELLN